MDFKHIKGLVNVLADDCFSWAWKNNINSPVPRTTLTLMKKLQSSVQDATGQQIWAESFGIE